MNRLTLITLRIWPGTGEYTLYEDDGHSFAYKDGSWATTKFRVSTTGETTIVEIEPRQGNSTSPPRKVVVVVGNNEQHADDSTRSLTF